MSALGEWFEQNQGSCILKSNTGLDCPGCGAQRSFAALLNGDFAEAWHHYPPLFPLLITLVLIIALLIRRHPQKGKIIRYSAYVTFAFIFVNYVANWVSGAVWE